MSGHVGVATIRLGTCAAVVAVVLSACAGGGDNAAGPTTTVTVTAPPPADSASPEPTSSSASSTSGANRSISGSSSPEPLGTAVSGRPLGLSDIFTTEGDWKEDRFDIADRTEIRGIGVPVNYCNPSSAPMLELRLARRFAKMSMSVGQANNSPSSDAVLVVEVVANGEQVDLRRVPFDQLQPFELDVQDVNALKIQVWIDPETCRGSREVVAVVENLVLSG